MTLNSPAQRSTSLAGILSSERWLATKKYIEGKEADARFPLDKINDMALLCAVAPGYAEIWLERHAEELSEFLKDRVAISTSRMFRIYMTLLVATARGSADVHGGAYAGVARSFQKELQVRCRAFPQSDDMAHDACFPAAHDTWPDEENLGLWLTITEVADQLALGDHTLLCHPPVPSGNDSEEKFTWTEAAFFQPGWRSILPPIVCTQARRSSASPPEVDLFRGRFDTPLSLTKESRCYLTVDGKPATTAILTSVQDRAQRTLDQLICEWGAGAHTEYLETRKLYLYATEAAAFARWTTEKQWEWARCAHEVYLADSIDRAAPVGPTFCRMVEEGTRLLDA